MASRWVVEIRDEGRGAFTHLRRELGLPDAIAAVQEVSKGKVTTDPQHHSGEGIFFSSKVVDLFELSSAGLVWVVDNVRGDQALGSSDVIVGTTVRLEVDVDSTRSVTGVFDAFTDQHRFNPSPAVITLFEYGERFVSRSEAKRVARGPTTRLEPVGMNEAVEFMVRRGLSSDRTR